jgi:hypothetical protein
MEEPGCAAIELELDGKGGWDRGEDDAESCGVTDLGLDMRCSRRRVTAAVRVPNEDAGARRPERDGVRRWERGAAWGRGDPLGPGDQGVTESGAGSEVQRGEEGIHWVQAARA